MKWDETAYVELSTLENDIDFNMENVADHYTEKEEYRPTDIIYHPITDLLNPIPIGIATSYKRWRQ